MEHGIAKQDNYQLPDSLWARVRNLILGVGALA